MRLALWQCRPTDGRLEEAFIALEATLTAAAAAGARLLVVPELYLPGYNRPDLHRRLAQDIGGDWVGRLRAMTTRAGCGVCLGWAERDGDEVYNAASVIGPDGALLGHYRKIQLYGAMEQASFAAGSRSAAIIELDGLRVGMLVCYDIEFPAHAARLGAAGAELILVPTANPVGFEHVQRTLVPARAHENDAVVAYANLVGPEGDLTFGGLSVVAGPDAMPLATAGAYGEALLVVDLAAVSAIPETGRSAQAGRFRPTAGAAPG